MQPAEEKCKPLRFVASGGLKTERSPLVFFIPSMTAAGGSRSVRWEASPGTRRISRQICGKDNNTTPPPPKKKQEAVGMRLTSMRISRKGGKYTQYTMVLPGAAAIALIQTRERVARFCLLDSCGANGNMHGASCARLQPMEKCETLSCYWIKVVRLGWLQQPHRRRCC